MSVSDDTPGRQAPGGRAYHDREVAVSQDIRNDPRYEQWRDAALERGFESLAVVPLEYEETFYGLLAVFASRPHAFDDAETEILAELGDDIAHALNAREIGADLGRTASRLEALFEQSPDMINVHDADGNLVEPNPKLCERTGYTADELTDMKVWDLDRTIGPDEAFALWESMDVGDSRRLEGVYRCKDGSTFPVEVHVRRLDLDGGPRFVSISREITDRKERERERRRRMDLFEKAQDMGDVGAWEYDAAADEARLTDEVYRIHGLPTDAKLTPESSLEFYHPDDRPRVREAFETAVQRGEEYDIEARLITTDGEQRWVRTRGDPQAEDGDLVRVRGTIKDITDRKRQEQRLERTVGRVTDAIVTVDSEWRFTFVDEKTEGLQGLDEDELLGRNCWDVFTEVRDTRIEEECRRVMTSREPTRFVEYAPRLDGWIDAQVYPDDDGGISVYYQQVTDRIKRERTLDRYESIIDRLPVGVFRSTLDGEFIDVNPEFVSLMDGDSKEELLTANAGSFYVDPEQRDELVDKLRQEGTVTEEELRIRTRSGDTIWVSTTLALTEHGDEQFIEGISQDITERKERERELSQAGTVFQQTQDALFLIDVAEDGFEIRRVNQAYEELTGLSIGDIRGKTPRAVVGDEAGAEIEARYRKCVERQAPIEYDEQLPIPGEETHWHTKLAPIIEDGEVVQLVGATRDVTQQRAEKRDLQRYETVLNTVPDGAYVLDGDFEFGMVNDALTELTGYSRDELLGAHASLLFDEDALEAGHQNRDRLLDGQSEYEHLHTEIETADGDRVPCEIRERLLGSDGEAPAATAGVVRDVTEQREREEELRRNERRFGAVFNAPNILAGILDPDGVLLATNATSMEYINETRADVIGEPFWETPWWSEEMRSVIKEAVEDAAQGEYVDYEASLTIPDGEQYDVEGVIRPVTDESGSVVSLVVSARDITDRKQRERDLAESEARYRTLAENFPNGGVFYIDSDFRYQLASGAGFSPIDTGPEDLVGNKISDVEPFSEEVVEMIEGIHEATLSGRSDRIEVSYEDRVFEVRTAPVREDGDVVAGLHITRDITEQREREEELQRQNERLEKFAGVVSHDLRNPLNMVEGRLELAKTECDSEHLVEAEAALDRCQTLVDDLLTLARKGQSVAETETVSLESTTERCWATVETADATLHADADRTIVADRSRLRQLIGNLIRNAIDHVGPDVTVEVGSLEDGFYVADDGPGIPESDREQVFESGYSTVQDNTGFGLAIVSEIVDAHGWDVTVTESASGGARFEITGVEPN